MKTIKFISGCGCCANTFGFEGKHWGLYLDVRHILNTATGIEIESAQRGPRIPHDYKYSVRRRIAIHLLWFSLRFNFSVLERMFERGVFSVCPAGNDRLALVLTAEGNALNSRYALYIDADIPFLPCVDGGWFWGSPRGPI